MYSTLSSSSAAATSAFLTRVNSLGVSFARSSSAPLIAVVISRIESGFCALKRSASITRVRVIELRSDRALNRVRNPICLFVDHLKLASFDEQPDLRLGPRVTQEHPALARQFFLRFVDELHNKIQLRKRALFLHGQISLGLR